MKISDLCKELNNWFDCSRYFGIFRIENGKIDLSKLTVDNSLQKDQYFCIKGSIFNDGVYQDTEDLELEHDETFNGAIWAMAIPPAVLELLDEINDWLKKYGDTINSPFQSESFGGYSYSKSGGGSAGNSTGTVTWQSHFADKLNRWRKL